MNQKNNLLRRFISYALVLCMMLGMSITVFAARVEALDTDGTFDIVSEIKGVLSEELVALYEQKQPEAIRLEYPICTPTHNYVALGGIVTAGDGQGAAAPIAPGYVELFANALSASGVEVNSANLGVSMYDADETFNELNAQNVSAYVEANRTAIADADLITYNLDSTILMSVILDIFNTEEADRTISLTKDEEELVMTTVAKLYDSLTADGSEIPYLNEERLESLAYVMIRNCVESKRALEKIAEMNPTADIVIIGMYNPFADVVVVINGESVDLGAMFDGVIEASDFYYTMLAILGDFTYVSVPDVEIIGSDAITAGTSISLGTLVMELLTNKTNLLATEAGHQHIADQLTAAVTFTDHRFERVAYTEPEIGVPGSETLECVKCGETETKEIPALEGELEPDPSVPETDPTTPEADPYTCDGGEACPVREFTDLDHTAWYHLGVDIMLNKGIMRGVGENKFAPNAEITRAELVTMLWRLEESPVTAGEIAFDDVAADSWYAEPVRWAVANGITNGVSETAFAPSATVTREQIAVMLARYSAYKGDDIATEHTLSAFTDANDVSGWALDAMEWANDIGLLQGTSGTTISPMLSGTRAQIAVILARLIGEIG